MKVLVIDDDPAILELVTQYLSLSAQHEVQSEASARDALAAIGESGPLFDCFLVDIQMPGVDGITLVKFIRERAEYRHTPIIMLTAMEDKEHVDLAFTAGATDYVTKPFDFYDLQMRMHTANEAVNAKVSAFGAPEEGVAARANAPTSLRIEDPISLSEIEGAIDYGEFENYVGRLLERHLYRVSAIAVKLGGIEQIHAEFTPDEFRELLLQVATEIRDVLLHVGGVFTYRGNGLFLCIPDRRLQGRRNAMQKALNKRHKVVHPTLGRIASTLYVGDQVPLGNGDGSGVLASLSQATDSVAEHSPGLSEWIDASKRLLSSDRRDGAVAWGREAGDPLT